MRPCIEPLGIHARHPCRAECGAAALTKQGRLQSATQSHYARTHNDSHTKPLHDAKPAEQATLNTHFQKHIGLSTVCNPPIFVGGFLYYLVILLSNGQRTVFTDFKQQYLFFLAGIGIYIYEHLSAVRRCAVKFIAIKLVCACGRHYGK